METEFTKKVFLSVLFSFRVNMSFVENDSKIWNIIHNYIWFDKTLEIFLNSDNQWWNSVWEGRGDLCLLSPLRCVMMANMPPESFLVMQMLFFCGWHHSPPAMDWKTLNIPGIRGLIYTLHYISLTVKCSLNLSDCHEKGTKAVKFAKKYCGNAS